MKNLLRLYITGTSSHSLRAISNLGTLQKTELQDHEIEVIDILEYPHLAEDENILATPTLVLRQPPPIRKIIGDLSDHQKVLFGLGLCAAIGDEVHVRQ